jgi:hypothetical protein
MILLAPAAFPFSIISAGVSEPKMNIKMPCNAAKTAVSDRMILHPISS